MRKNILKIENLSKSFNGLNAVDNVTFSIIDGTITSIVGPNGAGKTTLFNIINGFLKQDEGSIFYKGSSIDNFSPTERSALGVGRLWQDIRVFKNLTVLENLLVAKKEQPGEKLVNVFFKYKKVSEAEKNNLALAENILHFITLIDKSKSLAKDLSYGQQKLLGLGRLLMNDAELLLLDEPFAGVNPVMIDNIAGVLKELVQQKKTILIIEHNLPKAMEVSDWICVMDEGKIEIEGKPGTVSKDPQLKEVYLGI